MMQKKLNSSNRVHSSLLLYVTCIISVLTINLVNMGRGFGMELGQFLNNNFFSQCESNEFRQNGTRVEETIRNYIAQNRRDDSILYDIFMNNFKSIITDVTTNYLFLADEESLKRDSLFFIRKFQEFEDDTTTTKPSKYSLIKKINSSIYSSRKLFFSVLAEHLIDQNLQRRNFGDGDQLQLFYNNNMILTLTRKHGAQFGGKLSFRNNNEEKQYFVKTSFGYPIFNRDREKGAYVDTDEQMLSSRYSTFMSRSKSNLNAKSATVVDLKEPFVYKVLEQLDMGPKANFIINPYIKYGFYIVTEDLNVGDNSFTEMKMVDDMSIKIIIENVLFNLFRGGLDFDKYSPFSSLVNFNEIDIVNRVFTLDDFNTGNFGILNNENVDDAERWLSLNANLKIVDFRPSIKFDTGYIVGDIGTSFIEGNSFTKYDMTSIMYRAVCRKHREWMNLVPDAINNDRQIRETILRNDREKFYFGYRALLRFEDRLQQYRLNHRELFNGEEQIEGEQILGTLLQQQSQSIKTLMQTQRNDLPILDNRTNAELIGFKNGNAPNNVINPEERLQYINNAFDDLDVYSKGIVQNYMELRAFINNGYNIYFDENGNLRPVELQQQNRLQERVQQILQQLRNR